MSRKDLDIAEMKLRRSEMNIDYRDFVAIHAMHAIRAGNTGVDAKRLAMLAYEDADAFIDAGKLTPGDIEKWKVSQNIKCNESTHIVDYEWGSPGIVRG